MRRIGPLPFNLRFVLFAALISAGAATWVVLTHASALAPVTSVRPAGDAAIERLREAHTLVVQQSLTQIAADRREADAAAAQLADARSAAVNRNAAKLAAALPPAPPRRPADAAKTQPAAKAVVAAAAPDKPAGHPVNLAFANLSPEPPAQQEPRRGFLGRIASAAGDVGAGAWGAVSAAVKLPARVLPSRFL